MSNFTKEQREKILKRDNYQCQFDKLFGIVGLTGVPCSMNLEIHHKVYRKGRQFLKDGITVCKRCHMDIATNIIRHIRYEAGMKDVNLNNKFGFAQIQLGEGNV